MQCLYISVLYCIIRVHMYNCTSHDSGEHKPTSKNSEIVAKLPLDHLICTRNRHDGDHSLSRARHLKNFNHQMLVSWSYRIFIVGGVGIDTSGMSLPLSNIYLLNTQSYLLHASHHVLLAQTPESYSRYLMEHQCARLSPHQAD